MLFKNSAYLTDNYMLYKKQFGTQEGRVAPLTVQLLSFLYITIYNVLLNDKSKGSNNLNTHKFSFTHRGLSY